MKKILFVILIVFMSALSACSGSDGADFSSQRKVTFEVFGQGTDLAYITHSGITNPGVYRLPYRKVVIIDLVFPVEQVDLFAENRRNSGSLFGRIIVDGGDTYENDALESDFGGYGGANLTVLGNIYGS